MEFRNPFISRKRFIERLSFDAAAALEDSPEVYDYIVGLSRIVDGGEQELKEKISIAIDLRHMNKQYYASK